jgi:hypothetical protein
MSVNLLINNDLSLTTLNKHKCTDDQDCGPPVSWIFDFPVTDL